MRYIFFLLILLSTNVKADWNIERVNLLLSQTQIGRNTISFIKEHGIVISKYEYIKGSYRKLGSRDSFTEYSLHGQCYNSGKNIAVTQDANDDIDAAATIVHEIEHSRHAIKRLGLNSSQSEYRARVQDIFYYVELGNLGFNIEDREYFKNDCIVKISGKYFFNEDGLKKRMENSLTSGNWEYGSYKYGKKEVIKLP